jgi:hypothetical protein
VIGFNLVLFCAVQIGHETDSAPVPIRPRFKRPGPQAARKVRGEHAHANLLDYVPDAVEMRLVHHKRLTAGSMAKFLILLVISMFIRPLMRVCVRLFA